MRLAEQEAVEPAFAMAGGIDRVGVAMRDEVDADGRRQRGRQDQAEHEQHRHREEHRAQQHRQTLAPAPAPAGGVVEDRARSHDLSAVQGGADRRLLLQRVEGQRPGRSGSRSQAARIA
jgi:ribosomal protein S6E (S10)